MMTLEEAIKHCKDVALSCTNKECALEHFQLLKWLQEYSNMLEKQGEQKPTDKVEPKFKVGDILVSDEEDRRHIYKVDAISNYDTYLLLDLEDGYTRNESVYTSDLAMYLWTIKDAKDGDILFTSSTASHETFIFKNIDEKGNAKCYFAYDSEDGFRDGKYHFIGSATKCKPATKEQKDLLFQEMKEAGYMWDSEKKELKKIEKKFTWSEEDEEHLNSIISDIKTDMGAYPRSQEVVDYYNDDISFLKSLKNRCTWKPSQSMINALSTAVKYGQTDDLEALSELLKQLKEL